MKLFFKLATTTLFSFIFSSFALADGDQDIYATGDGLPVIYQCKNIANNMTFVLQRGGRNDMTLVRITRNTINGIKNEIYVPRAPLPTPPNKPEIFLYQENGFKFTVFPRSMYNTDKLYTAELITRNSGIELLKCNKLK